MSDLIAKAQAFAERKHDGQVRKYTGEPYANHLREVAKLLSENGQSDEVVAAGWLHDTLEDTTTTREELTAEFGKHVAQLVWEVTDLSRPSDGNRKTRKAIDRDHLAHSSGKGASIKLADLISNTASIVDHDPAFAKVYLAEKAQLLPLLTHGNSALFDAAFDSLAKAERKLQEQTQPVA